jgi:hypothetical protein
MNVQDYWIPVAVTNLIALVLIFICYRWPKVGKVVWGIIFILAGVFNIVNVIRDPQVYLTFGDHAADFYKFFIDGVFHSFTMFIVSLIGAAQIVVGLFLLRKGNLFFLGILGGIIFLVAIAPLGIGSAFPATLLMAISLITLYLRYKKA